MTERAERILRFLRAALQGEQSVESLIAARDKLEDIIPPPARILDEHLAPLGEALCEYFDTAFITKHVCGDVQDCERASLAVALAFGLFTDGMIELGRVLQQDELSVRIPVEEGV